MRAVKLGAVICAVICAVIGLVLPVVFIAVDAATPGGWWPPWIMYFWPADFMLGVASGNRDWYFFEIAGVAISINVVLYAVVGAIAGVVVRQMRLVASR